MAVEFPLSVQFSFDFNVAASSEVFDEFGLVRTATQHFCPGRLFYSFVFLAAFTRVLPPMFCVHDCCSLMSPSSSRLVISAGQMKVYVHESVTHPAIFHVTSFSADAPQPTSRVDQVTANIRNKRSSDQQIQARQQPAAVCGVKKSFTIVHYEMLDRQAERGSPSKRSLIRGETLTPHNLLVSTLSNDEIVVQLSFLSVHYLGHRSHAVLGRCESDVKPS